MSRKALSSVLASLLVLMANPTYASSKAEKEAQLAGKVKAGIHKLGVGEEARVAIKLRDKTRLVGYISEASEDRFVVKDLKTGAATPVAYANVAQVSGQNLTTGAKMIIGMAVVVAMFILMGLAAGD